MSKTGKSAKPVRRWGFARSRHVIEQNIQEVQRWLGEGISTKNIAYKLAKRRGISSRTAYRYVKVARARWTASLIDELPTIREQRLARLRYLANKWEDTEPPSCVQVEREIDRIVGVCAPEKFDARVAVAHIVAPQGPPPLDLTVLDDDELDAFERAIGKLQRGVVLDAPALLAPKP